MALSDFHLSWQDQCDAARDIRERFGTEKALGYLVGEKLMNFVRAFGDSPEFHAELPKFVAEVRDIFDVVELRHYLDSVKRLGALGHVCSDEEFDTFRAHGAIEESPVHGAEDILVMEQIRELLLTE